VCPDRSCRVAIARQDPEGEGKGPGKGSSERGSWYSTRLVLTKLKAEVLSETPAELIMSSATEAFSAGSFGARNGSVGRTRTSYLSSAA
jgi:hypothetical protein